MLATEYGHLPVRQQEQLKRSFASFYELKYKGDYHPSELLCPTTYRWVDAESAKKTLLRDSPEHHCCTLYREGDGDCKNKNGGSLGCGRISISSKRSRPQSPLFVKQEEFIVDRIPMEIGAGMLVTIGMLQPGGQELVRPLLQEFADKVGSAAGVLCAP